VTADCRSHRNHLNGLASDRVGVSPSTRAELLRSHIPTRTAYVIGPLGQLCRLRAVDPGAVLLDGDHGRRV